MAPPEFLIPGVRRRKQDFSTVIGVVLAFVLVAWAIALGSNPSGFLNFPSILIVLGGTVAISVACYSLDDVWRAQKLFVKTIFYHSTRPEVEAMKLMEMADSAKRNGILSLQNHIAGYNLHGFLEKGITMIVDSVPVEHVERILNQDIISMAERHRKGVAILRRAAEIAPAMGLIGTLIGLVQMLGDLSDPGNIGPAMAVALLTTLYGAMLAFMVFTPVASKLERNSKEEILLNQICAKGVVAIGRGENLRNMEALLNTILPPSRRIQYFA